jgi:hypothetical protein
METERNATKQINKPSQPTPSVSAKWQACARDSIPERQVCVDSCAAPQGQRPAGTGWEDSGRREGGKFQSNSSASLLFSSSSPRRRLWSGRALPPFRDSYVASSWSGLLRVLRTLVRSISWFVSFLFLFPPSCRVWVNLLQGVVDSLPACVRMIRSS